MPVKNSTWLLRVITVLSKFIQHPVKLGTAVVMRLAGLVNLTGLLGVMIVLSNSIQA